MIIKTNEFELEITQGSEVYLGSKTTGQTFKNWSDIDDDIKIGLAGIVKQAEILVKHSEALLCAATNA